MFVSSIILAGDRVGGASTRCNDLAAAAGLDGAFVAWISTEESDVIDLVDGDGPWRLVSGTQVFETASTIVDGPEAPINEDENGQLVEPTSVYTGTNSEGRWSGFDCKNWTSYYSDADATIGQTDQIGSGWTAHELVDCSKSRRVLCVQTIP